MRVGFLPARPKAVSACILIPIRSSIKCFLLPSHPEGTAIACLSMLAEDRIDLSRSYPPVREISVPDDKIAAGGFSASIASGTSSAAVLDVPINPDPLALGTTGLLNLEALSIEPSFIRGRNKVREKKLNNN
jgi:hypothetical protein